MPIVTGLLRRFQHDAGGNIAVVLVLSAVPIVGAMGVATDISSASNVRSILQIEADAAVLEVVKAAAETEAAAASSKKSRSEREAIVESRTAQIKATRIAILNSRLPSERVSDIDLRGQWVDKEKTEYTYAASASVKRYFTIDGISSLGSSTQIVAVAAAKLDMKTSSSFFVPELKPSSFEASSYNRIYAYCFDEARKSSSDGGRSKMTPVASNGMYGPGGALEMATNPAFTNVKMPTCGATETLSWRLYHVYDKRVSPDGWPKDVFNSATQLWDKVDASSVTIYNHYSDTKINPATKLEEYAFRGDVYGFNFPINILEVVVCDSIEKCTPKAAGSEIPSGKNRAPVAQNAPCSTGKYMYMGWEDLPFLPKDPSLNDYSSANSFRRTDSDYNDISIVVKCQDAPAAVSNSSIRLSR